MSTLTASNAFYSLDSSSQSPPKPASPVTPTAQYASSQQAISTRSFINLNPEIRGQHAPFPITPTAASSGSSLEAPLGISFADYLKSWTDNQTTRWLAECKCAHHAETFKANDIRGDILLELDQVILKEMGITSIGDRLRMLNAVKILRQRAANRVPAPSSTPARHADVAAGNQPKNAPPASRPHTKRPAPLRLNGTHAQNDLPGVVREQPPDSAKSSVIGGLRPLPQPGQQQQSANQPPFNGPVTPGYVNARSQLPPLPPPRGQPPPPPPSGRPPARPGLSNNQHSNWVTTPTQEAPPSYTATSLLPAPQQNQLLTPVTNNWSNTYHSPADSRPGNASSKIPPRSTSPLSGRGVRPNPTNPAHGRNGSGSLTSPSTSSPLNKLPPRPSTTGTTIHPHPYANPQAASLQPPANHPAHSLSPIDEHFNSPQPSSNTPSPPLQYTTGRGPFHNNNGSGSGQLTLDEIRRKLVKFVLPDEGLTYTIDVATCSDGTEVLEKVLKKFGKGGSKTVDGDAPLEHAVTAQGGLTVNGWGVYLDIGQPDITVQPPTGEPLPVTEAELMSICHAPPDHPSREHGLVLRKTKVPRRTPSPSCLNTPSTSSTSKTTKRASSISILSSLGVRDPERALDPPPSPTSASGRLSPAALSATAKRPSKLRNFFGQRPPSELITNHLLEYFPNTEKKILERTARHSMMLKAKRESFASVSNQPLPSRFSVSTRGSISPSRTSLSSNLPPPVPDKYDVEEDLPRMSLSTEDGRSIDLHPDDSTTVASTSSLITSSSSKPLLPPIPFPTESLAESIEGVTRRRMSRTTSTSSRRMSYMTELRSKRDRSDTASLMTVDEITAEVESRRVSSTIDRGDEMDEWTKVDVQETPDAPVDEKDVVAEQEEEEDSEGSEDEDEDDDVGVTLDGEDDDIPKGIETKFKSNKWIKGALIGAGSFGKVYLGMDASNGLLMAVKQVELPTGSLPNQERKKSMLSALEREIELLKNLQHENIVQYLYSSVDDEFLNIFLEYVPGGSVATLLRNYGAFEETLVKNFVRQILSGLSYLHERDIIHRDIKGANILVDNKGGVKISDFGISKKVNDNLLASKVHRFSLQGSVFWMAPEVVKQSGHTLKADIWGVGCLVVEMLTGEHPWAQLTQMQAIFKIGSSAKPTMPSDISSEAVDFLEKTFEVDQKARPSAPELSEHPFVKRNNLPMPSF
ncbi:Pkinase-domain-containing protein [Macrolepiota fuliginosa MF-IS2]|uniref:Pkinase-domain-containing protein n=1 Tax=Macrolepiota fuliginosa MF-IS2 TaxID=1400762 RepID=A0A9P6CAY2_9AGAR|nr:Pkinase-domain-containing protein [Macrolepiota fuliginosa MF-IS2]